MKTMECTNCGAAARVTRGCYQFKDSGLRNVVVQGIELARCPRCSNEDAILPRVNELMRVLALAVIGKPYRLSGEEVRFLRGFLAMTAEKLSRLLHVDKATLSKWENGEDPVGAQSDLLIRMLALALGDRLQDKIPGMAAGFDKISPRRKPVGIQVKAATLEYRYA